MGIRSIYGDVNLFLNAFAGTSPSAQNGTGTAIPADLKKAQPTKKYMANPHLDALRLIAQQVEDAEVDFITSQWVLAGINKKLSQFGWDERSRKAAFVAVEKLRLRNEAPKATNAQIDELEAYVTSELPATYKRRESGVEERVTREDVRVLAGAVALWEQGNDDDEIVVLTRDTDFAIAMADMAATWPGIFVMTPQMYLDPAMRERVIAGLRAKAAQAS